MVHITATKFSFQSDETHFLEAVYYEKTVVTLAKSRGVP